jgi:ketosteroid isomerase-like protein
MSQENAEIVRATYKAWTDGDFDALLDTLDPGFEFRTSGVFPDFAPLYLGHDGIRSFWDEMRVPWEWFHLDAERIVEGEDCAAAVIHFRARGRGSGVVTDGHAVWFRDGRMVKASAHRSFEDALEAVGLRE